MKQAKQTKKNYRSSTIVCAFKSVLILTYDKRYMVGLSLLMVSQTDVYASSSVISNFKYVNPRAYTNYGRR